MHLFQNLAKYVYTSSEPLVALLILRCSLLRYHKVKNLKTYLLFLYIFLDIRG